MTLYNKKSAQKWITNIVQKHNHSNMIFDISFNNDNIYIYGDLCPNDPCVRRTWKWIVHFKSINKVDLERNQNPLYLDITLRARLFKSFKRINLNEKNNLDPKSVFKNIKFVKESKVKEVKVILSNSIIRNKDFSIELLKENFKLATS